MRHAIPLAALRGFEAFGRAGSVKRAGEELSISPTVISRHIQNLEQALKVRLVTPSGRRLVLTEQGQAYFAEIRRAFAIIQTATSSLIQPAARPLHICCPPGLASRRLLTRLPELEALLGGRQVTLEPTSTRPDLSDSGIDAAVFYAEDHAPSVADVVSAEPFFKPRILAVCSPAFKDGHLRVDSIRDLVGLPLLFEQTTRHWEMWFDAAGVTKVVFPQLRRLWNSQLTFEAARLDQGIALASELLVAAEDDDLVEIVSSNIRLGTYYFLTKKKDAQSPTMLALRSWIIGVCSPTARA